MDKAQHTKAMVVTKNLGLTAKANQRTRRPTLEELDKIVGFNLYKAQKRQQSIPMHHIIPFAIFSTRRQEEICSLMWCDIDEAEKRVLVRNMKHPGDQLGNDVVCDLPDPAPGYVLAQPKIDERIFPFNHKSVSSSFTKACEFLAIEDLHFHDLRHEGVSRLFEMGYTIPHAAAVSGHRSWSSLQRYAHVKQKGDKYQDWRYLSPPEAK